MAKFDLDDVVVTKGGARLRPALMLKAGSNKIRLAVFDSEDDAALFAAILAEARTDGHESG